jgi:putative ABC transport system ATP-binding protein
MASVDARAPARTPVILTRGLGKVYSPGTQAEVVALKSVDLTIDRGDLVAIMGSSGSGKSTLMNLLGCLDTPSSGSYACDGIDVSTLDAEALAELRRDKIGFVFQGFNLLPRMHALDNVAMPLGYARVPLRERRERAQAALAAVGLADRAHHLPSELSGGQQQRVAIARALINNPPIVLADEPTGALDSKTGEEILALFKRLREAGHTVVIITHDPDVAAHADHIFVMRDGELYPQEAGSGDPGPGTGHPGPGTGGQEPGLQDKGSRWTRRAANHHTAHAVHASHDAAAGITPGKRCAAMPPAPCSPFPGPRSQTP